MPYYTDRALGPLGDQPGARVIREVRLIWWDAATNLVRVTCKGQSLDLPPQHIYARLGFYGDAPEVSPKILQRIRR